MFEFQEVFCRSEPKGTAQAEAVPKSTCEESLGYILIPKCEPHSKPLIGCYANPCGGSGTRPMSLHVTWPLPSDESKGNQDHLDQVGEKKRYRKTQKSSIRPFERPSERPVYSRPRRCHWDVLSRGPGCRGRSRLRFYDENSGVDSTQTSATRNGGDRASTVRHIPRSKVLNHVQLTLQNIHRATNQCVVRRAHKMVPAPPWRRRAVACGASMAQTQERGQEGSHPGPW
jgi:hypothetical protein